MSKDIIWQDIHWFRILLILFFIPFTLVIIKVVIPMFLLGAIIGKLVAFAMLAFYVYLCIGILLPRFTYITKYGVGVGNPKDDQYTSIRLNPPVFVPWNNIKKIILLNKLVRRPTMSVPTSFLIVKTKDGKKYWCFLARKEGFISLMKKLKKEKLLSDGKPSDLFLEKERPFINYSSPEVNHWTKLTLPWIFIVLLLGVFLPEPYGIKGKYMFIWIIVAIAPVMIVLPVVTRLNRR
ncbi:hypothetical protein HYW20_04930 [Candidatus Woesearchaeota archaeon]|nr:hypothetical protein [Candidatus Woesearchaeota archaeon]